MSKQARAQGTARDSRERRTFYRSTERALRLWSGVILMVFVTSHLLNHALGVFGVAVMSEVQEWRYAFWRSWTGSILLIGAAGLHVALSLWRVVSRRTWRMPVLEAVQILLGLLVPVLLVGHIVSTRVMSSLAEVDDSYVSVLRALWPNNALMQSAALLVVWGHGVVGLYFAFHVRRWFKRVWIGFAVLAVLIPMLALAGFVAAGREALKLTEPPEVWTAQQVALQSAVTSTARWAIAGVFALTAIIIAIRLLRAKLGPRITVRYVGHGEVTTAPGLTLLEVSRNNDIPHPSACGGRGRCSSCRILVIAGSEDLPAPSDIERRMLDRIRAPKNVRLGCQIRPGSDISLRVLLSSDSFPATPEGTNEALDWGVEEELTVLSADIRGFATLAQNQLPADLVALLTRLIGEMGQAIESHGGRVTAVQTDGIIGAFGRNTNPAAGSRAALNAAADILKAINAVNKDLRASLPLPIRVGIGIHSGPAILANADDRFGGQRMIVIGETIVVASRLEEATKEMAADCIVSSRTIALAGFATPPSGERPVYYKNGMAPVLVHAFSDKNDLRMLLRKRLVEPDQAATAPTVA